MNVWVVLPTYNEISNLAPMVTTLLEGIHWYRLFLRPARQPESVAAGVALGPEGKSPGRTASALAGTVPAPSPAAAGEGWGEGHPVQLSPIGSNGHLAARHVGNGHDSDPNPQVSILIVDDNSSDGTGALADELAQQYPGRIMVLHRPCKQGLGTAYRAGFTLALQNGADVVIEMDADFSHSPSYLPDMLSLLEDHDVVVGSRWASGGSLDKSWEPWRYLLSKYANVYARWVTGLDVYDTTAGFKAFRADALRRLPIDRVRSDGYAFQIEMATACQRYGLRVAELPIHFEERVRGKSKMSMRIICEAAWRVWQIRFFPPTRPN